jgi:hypothetical protein
VDTFLSGSALERIGLVIDRGAVGGCLTMRIDDPGFIFRVYERGFLKTLGDYSVAYLWLWTGCFKNKNYRYGRSPGKPQPSVVNNGAHGKTRS